MSESSERKQALERQVERVLSAGSGQKRQVIIRMATPMDDHQTLIDLASDALKQRNMAQSARECLPAPKAAPAPVAVSQYPAWFRRVSDPHKSFADQVGRKSIESVSTEELKVRGHNFLTELVNSDIIQRAVREERKSGGRITTWEQRSFWTSKSMLLELKTNDLEVLPTAVPNIRDIYPNRILRSPRLVETKYLPPVVLENKTSSWGVGKIGALGVWGAYGAKGQGVNIGILDTGIDADHPDLAGKVVAFAEFDADGRQVKGAKAHDTDQHGTHCAGTIVGGTSGGQWIGVAPEAKLAVALVLNGKKGGTDAQVLAGIDWLVEQKVDVISMSLGGLTLDPETPNTYTEAILTCLRAGIPVVTAIGNEGSQTTGSPGNDLFAFAVGATDYFDRAAGFSGGRTHIIRQSNFIPPQNLPLPYSKPDVSAPGVAVLSSVPKGRWAAFNGTSMATPHVAGAIALILSATEIKQEVPEAERAFVLQDLLTGSAEELGESGQNHRFGFGRIDVLRAVGFAIDRGYGTPLSAKTAAGSKAAKRRQTGAKKRRK